MIKIVLTAVERKLAKAWERLCGDLENVSIHHGSILDVSCDAVVSPANSFGFMDGGVDLVYSHRSGWQVQERLQELIRTKHHGELLVGTAEIVKTDDSAIPYLISAPTMRVPMSLRDSINPYLAARAFLLLIKHGRYGSGAFVGEKISDVVQTVAFPGLATGVGQVSVNVCAQQVRAAIEDVMLEQQKFPQSWADAQAKHQLLYIYQVRNSQF